MSTSLSPSGAPNRQVWLVVWGAFTAAPILYGTLAPMVAPGGETSAQLATIRRAFLIAGLLAFWLAMVLMPRAMRAAEPAQGLFAYRPQGELATPHAFQARSLVCMALFESAAVFGFVLTFLGAPPLEVWAWTSATLVGMVAEVLPFGLFYWRVLKLSSASGAGSPG